MATDTTAASPKDAEQDHDPTHWVSDRFVQFVDIVFGVVVVQGFVRYADLILDPSKFRFAFAALAGVYVLTTLSWVGYHQSMHRHPYKTTTIDSWIRMGFDFLIVSVYARLIFSIEGLRAGSQTARLDNYILNYLLVFVFYILSGLARRREQNDPRASRLTLLILWSVYYAALLAGYKIVTDLYGTYSLLNGLFLLACVLPYIGYRIMRQRRYENRS